MVFVFVNSLHNNYISSVQLISELTETRVTSCGLSVFVVSHVPRPSI